MKSELDERSALEKRGWRDVALLCVGLALGLGFNVSYVSIGRNPILYATIAVVFGLFSMYWLTRATEKKNVVNNLWAFAIPVIVFFTMTYLREEAEKYSVRQFEAERSAFASDPNGFEFLKKLAQKEYGVTVFLAGSSNSAASPLMRGSAHAVSQMRTEVTHCTLSFSKAEVIDTREIKKDKQDLWIRGVLMHELAHCLDRRRDIQRPGEFQTRSLSPAVAPHHDVDAESFVAAEETAATKLWREAFADIFTAGYWRLSATPKENSYLVENLGSWRAENAKVDPTHATTCWIRAAADSIPPAGLEDLVRWADEVRKTPECASSISNT